MNTAGIKLSLTFLILIITFCSKVQAKGPYLAEGTTKEVSIYQIERTSLFTILNMGYASSVIQNPEIWNAKYKKIFEVDIVFTAYPKNKEAWLTNYDHLLNERIKALQSMEPILKENKGIKWNFILQTSCNNEDDAKRMFHGTIIKYQYIIPERTEIESASQKEELELVYNEIESAVYGFSSMEDSVVFKTFNRNKWNNMLIINDWTGSMYPYGAQSVLWYRLNFDKKGVKYFIFFNDGNQKLDRQKRIGNTGGIYYCKPDSIEFLLKVMKLVAKRGSGGDIPENNIEAILKGIRLIKGFDELVMIADNSSGVRDMVLLNRVTFPVRIVLCGVGANTPIHPHYLEIARSTGGSIHTIEEDIFGLQNLKEGEKVKISGIEYNVKRGKLIQSKRRNF